MQITNLESKWQELEEEMKDFQKSFKCSCKQQTIWTSGEKLCKHLLKEQNERFNKKILKIVSLEAVEKGLI